MDSSLVPALDALTQVDSISADWQECPDNNVEPLADSSLVPLRESASADSSDTDVPSQDDKLHEDEEEQRMPVQDVLVSRKRPATDFLPINTVDIKNIGIEVSDEEAQQFQNDFTRLSPVTVGLREKTLEEISLTTESCSFESPAKRMTKRNESSVSSSNGDLDGSPSKQMMLVWSRIDDNQTSPTAAKRQKLNYPDPKIEETPKVEADPKPTEDVEVEKNANAELDVKIEKDAKAKEDIGTCRSFTVEKLEENEEFKLEDGEAVKVTMSNAKSFTNDIKMCEHSLPVNQQINFVESQDYSDDLAYAAIDPEETETGSDSSEIAASNAQIEFHDCENNVELGSQDVQNNDIDPLGCEDLMRRLKRERPEDFTEDSAESLAMATGVRDEVRSDGSDSGLGSEIPGESGPVAAPESDSETLFLDRIQDDILSTKEKEERSPQMSLQTYPLKSNLKRRLTDCMDDGPNAKRLADEPAKKKRSIQFDAVTVYYFPRAQGFTCVPSQGGSTLGMSATHTHAERFSLTEHAAEQRRVHRARLAQLRSERAAKCVAEGASSSEDPSDDTDEEPTDTEEIDIDSYYFLQPVPTWQRRALLRSSGIRRIDTMEKDECRDIRASREHCGCACKGYCDPESCPCSRANVKCQVDRAGFPCGCSRDGCANSSGRIEFNPVRVRTHFIHTLMRLEIEKKQREEERNETEAVVRNCPNEMNLGSVLESAPDMNQSENLNANGNVEGVVNGDFSGLHYDTNQENRNGSREDSLDLYAMRDDCYPNDDTMENSSVSQRKNGHPEFGTAFPSFPGPSVGFQQNTYSDYTSYQTLPSSTTYQCREFAPYNTPYVHATAGYDAPFVEETTESQYTNLNAVQQPMNAVVQQMNKLEPFSELLAGRYSYYGEVESQSPVTFPTKSESEREETVALPVVQKANHESEPPRDDNPDDCDENFGEIIKKSMVETVSA